MPSTIVPPKPKPVRRKPPNLITDSVTSPPVKAQVVFRSGVAGDQDGSCWELNDGSGKSLFYQILAMVLPGITLVRPEESTETLRKLKEGFIKSFSVSLVVVDEAHCVSEWSSYTRLKADCILAMTATATTMTLQAVMSALEIPSNQSYSEIERWSLIHITRFGASLCTANFSMRLSIYATTTSMRRSHFAPNKIKVVRNKFIDFHTPLHMGEVQYLRMLPQLNVCWTLNFHKVSREARVYMSSIYQRWPLA
ncbi:unnamed protein product [Thlaspi arvense]|uniref:Helicase ATP-binding domain-containing protein n=1 Tax=Thlaspi arvense TaxID=13288 RepID=A0AAU9TAA1_THLAR|nr:unnamed protein product [Thlaspi arvense]